MRFGKKLPSSSTYFNEEVSLNEILIALGGGGGLSSSTLSSVNDSDSSQVLLAANSNRRGTIIFNDSTAILYVALASTASTSSFSYKLNPNNTLELFGEKNYTGVISGIWASNASGAARITELES